MPKLPPPPRLQYVLPITDPSANSPSSVSAHVLRGRHGRSLARCRAAYTPLHRIRPGRHRPRIQQPQGCSPPWPAPSFDDRPIPVAGVAGFLEELEPALRVVVELRREHPALEDLLLLGRVVAVDDDERVAARDALDLRHGLDGAGTREVVDRIERQDA